MKFKKGDLVAWRKDNDIAIVVKASLPSDPECMQVKWLMGEYEGQYTEPLALNFKLLSRADSNKRRSKRVN
jgi:hypothetical protein